MSELLDPHSLDHALSRLDGWSGDSTALTKTYRFESFAAAVDFIRRAAEPIDEMNHHPEWTNVYDKVEVRLTSHDAGGVTERDVALAKTLDGLAG